jgi:signal transduction histidine kinase/ketosteroid isomerase-like protein
MKLTKKLEAEILKLYHAYWDAYLRGDMKSMASFFDDNITVYGTAVGEIFTTKKQAVKFYAATADQMTGNAEFRKRRISLKAVGDTIMINEQTDLYVLIDGKWTFYGHARITAIFEQKSNAWKLVHQHGSFPDNRTEEGDQIATDKIKEENLQLRDAVKRRTIELEEKNQELEIESSLERVRTVAMGMNKPDDILGICKIMFIELHSLGFSDIRNTLINFWDDSNNSLIDYDYSDYAGGNKAKLAYSSHPVFEQFQKKIKKSKDAFAKLVVKKDELESWKQRRRESGEYEDPRLNNIPALYYYFYSIGVGSIGISTFSSLTTEQLDLLKRFRNVFSLAYQRYIDISLAEAQARETQIQLALERVRARTMAMQKSEELHETSQILFQQMKELGEPVEQLTIGIVMETENVVEIFATIQGSQLQQTFRHSIDEMVMNKIYRGWKAQQKSLLVELNSKEIQVYNRYRNELVKSEMFSTTVSKDDRRIIYAAYFSKGMLALGSNTTLSEDSHRLLERFAGVFDGIYTRFLDLQKAEAQAREAQIEVSLERVRSRAMAMHNSTDLNSVVAAVFEELGKLNLGVLRCGVGIFNKEKQTGDVWSTSLSSEGTVLQVSGDESFTIHPLLQGTFDAWLEQKEFYYELEGKDFNDYYKALTKTNFQLTGQQSTTLENKNLKQYYYTPMFQAGNLYAFSEMPFSEDAKKIMKRFAGVLNLTYNRFLDLQKAEAQAREAQIELALERVRARTMAMQHSNELAEAASLLFHQLKTLGIETFSSGYTVWVNDEKDLVSWMCNADGSMNPPFIMPVNGDVRHVHMYQSWKSGEAFYVEDMSGKTMEEHYRYLRTFPLLDEAFKTSFAAGFTIPSRQVHNIANFLQGNLLFITYEPVPEAHEIFKRFAKVFEQTYTRFNDLQKAEEQARESQIELGLERVRARAMAMQKSEELKELIGTVFIELTKLDLVLTRCLIMIYDPKTNDSIWWMANSEAPTEPIGLKVQYHGHVTYLAYLKAWQEKQLKWTYSLEGKTKKQWDDFLFTETKLSGLPDFVIAGMKAPEKVYLNASFNSFGNLTLATLEPLSGEHFDTMLRFAKVFDLTYTRFNDLQKAEAQAREAQIELGLERVRARAMAMQKSHELSELVDTVFKELTKLDFALSWCMINIVDEPSMSNTVWGVNPEIGKAPESYHMLFEDYRFHHEMFKAWKEKQSKWTIVLEGKEKEIYDEYLFNQTEFRRVPETVQKQMRATKKYEGSFTFSNFGGLQTIGEEPLSEANMDILARFGKVFDLTYTRFNDLQKAEAQAREAKIEAALETVRARSMAMHHSEELEKVVKTLSDKLIDLGLSLDGAFIFFFEKKKRNFHLWIATNHLPAPIKVDMPYNENIQNNPIIRDLWRVIETGGDLINKSYSGRVKDDYFGFVGEYNQTTIPAEIRKFHLNTKSWTVSLAAGKNSVVGIDSWSGKIITEDDFQVLKRFSKVFEQAYTRFLDLQKAEAQAKEAQIEAALERVRSQSMGMQTSKDLSNVTTAMFEQLRMLGGELYATGIVFCDKHEHHVEQWHSVPGAGMLSPFIVPVDLDRIHQYRYDQWKKGTELFSVEIPEDFIAQHFDAMFKLPTVKAVLDDFASKNIPMPETPSWEIDYGASFKYGYILVSALQPFTEAAILPRFAKVFEQTYIRFLDLQKAEAQTREAQIQLALERVRSKAMAMHHSDELDEVLAVLCDQFDVLGILPMSTHMTVMDLEKNTFTFRETGKFGDRSFGEQTVDLDAMDTWKDTVDQWKESKALSINRLHFPKETLPQVWEVFHESFASMPEGSRITPDDYPDGIYHTAGKHPFGYIGMNQTRKATEEEEQIVIKFANEFGIAYQRFLDLQKAEAQAREARIETALEKVRSRTMAMQHSDELPHAANLLFLEVQALGIPSWSCGYNILADDNKSSTCIMSSEGQIQSAFQLPFTNSGEPSFAAWLEAIETKQSFFVQELGGKAIDDHYNYMKTLPQVGRVIKELEDAGISLPTYQINHLSFFNGGFLLFITYEQVPHAHDIFKRFTKVFEQTYTRFLDLQKAEAQTREAKIETALERVRARALAMQEPEELKDVAEVLRHEMGLLGVEELETCSIYINDASAERAECWYALKDVHSTEKKLVNDHFSLDLNDTWVGREMLQFYNSSEKQTSIVMQGVNRKEWINYCEEKSIPFRGYYGKVIPDRTYHLYKFSHGAIGAAAVADISNESWNLLKRAASVFSLAYSRFKDLTQARTDLIKLKEEKKRAEEALTNLQAAQKQLVQSEKMASLGELTAGIAHEIQNPLNFVNNFSEVSKELLDEMREAIEKGDTVDAKEIMNDVIQNLEKINHHGKRADAIVKGMLQHSRSSNAVKEPSDINALCDEYLRLSYHGLRAKDKSFNASLKTDFDVTLEKINIIPQDIGRVVLNLINNAFYAVAEKKKQQAEGYEPTVTVTTSKNPPSGVRGAEVVISVTDNGSGIPPKVLDKIFQPFFTTKPTGLGTGLGLSLSYDIVTKGHGGELKVESVVGEGTEFIILLPIV